MPLPLCPGAQPVGTPLSDLSGEHWTEPLPPEPYRLVAQIDAPFVEKILQFMTRQRKSNVHHLCKADDLG